LRLHSLRRLRPDPPFDFKAIDFTYFYFDKQRNTQSSTGSALRVILTQLLHAYRTNPDIIDILLVLWNEQTSGQLFATEEEVTSAIKLLLGRLGKLILVLDGVDECRNPEILFKRLDQFRQVANSFAVALFLRPTLPVPLSLSRDSFRLRLRSNLNMEGIRNYVRSKIGYLIDDGSLPDSVELEPMVENISLRANGMFLWTALLVEYLQSPFVSTRQKLDATHNLNRFEGLDSLYFVILESLERQIAHGGQTNIARAFQMVAYAYQPMHIRALECIVAMPLDRPVEHEDHIPNFSTNLGQISGALMELGNDMTVRFIHVSLFDYLRDTKRSQILQTTGHKLIDTDETLAHAVSAACCLSYLNYTIPHEPLGGSAQTVADPQLHREKYPFLEYAAQFWSAHLLDCMKNSKVLILLSNPELSMPIIQLASRFLSDTRAVTLWIEACWMFGFRPWIGTNADVMIGDLPIRFPLKNVPGEDQLKRAFDILRHLASDLELLNRDWGKTLRNAPNEIWEPSISAFTRSSFWLAVAGSTVEQITTEKGSICLRSRVSSNGQHLGIARLLYPFR
jgi:hypothetical protein